MGHPILVLRVEFGGIPPIPQVRGMDGVPGCRRGGRRGWIRWWRCGVIDAGKMRSSSFGGFFFFLFSLRDGITGGLDFDVTCL